MLKRLALLILSTAAPALAEAPRVVTDIAPVHSLVSSVMAGVGEPDVMLPPGASPHSFSMRPSDAAALDGADVVFWIGPALTPWLEHPISTLADDAVSVPLFEDHDTFVLSLEDDEGGHKGHDDHDHGHGHEGNWDPHAWLDPDNARAWVGVMARVLSDLDPEHRDLYMANAATTLADLDGLLAAMAPAFQTLADKTYAVDHDAFGYLEHHFQVSHAFAITTGHNVAPGPARIGELRKTARDKPVDCVLVSTNETDRLVRTVFESLSPNVIRIDLIGAEQAPGPLLYMDLMQELARRVDLC